MSRFARIYLDTNTLIGMTEDYSDDGKALRRMLAAHGTSREPRFRTSVLTFSELLVRPYREGERELATFYFDLSLGAYWLDVSPVSFEILETAALLRAMRKSLKLPDAIHIASAIRSGCSHLLTGDHGVMDVGPLAHPFRAETIPGVPVIRPDLPTLSQIIEDLAA